MTEQNRDQNGMFIDKNENGSRRIYARRSQYKGRAFIDVRVFYDKDGEYLPTSQGVTLPYGPDTEKLAKEIARLAKLGAKANDPVADGAETPAD